MRTSSLFVLLLLAALATVSSYAAPVLAFRLVVDAPSTNSERLSYVAKEQNIIRKQELNVDKVVLFDETSIKSAHVNNDNSGRPEIDLVFSESGARKFADVTQKNLNKQLAIVMDGKVLQAPVIRSAITGGTATISGRFTKEQAEELAKRINEASGKKF